MHARSRQAAATLQDPVTGSLLRARTKEGGGVSSQEPTSQAGPPRPEAGGPEVLLLEVIDRISLGTFWKSAQLAASDVGFSSQSRPDYPPTHPHRVLGPNKAQRLADSKATQQTTHETENACMPQRHPKPDFVRRVRGGEKTFHYFIGTRQEKP